jgi:chromosome segregation ATPase
MLDAFKKSANKQQQAAELESLIAASREERAALSTMLTQIQLHGAKLAGASKSLQEVEEKAGKANTRLNEVTERLAKTDARTAELDALDGKIRALEKTIAQAERETSRLTAPDGELEKHKAAMEALSSQALETRANLDALKQDQAVLDEVRGQLRQAQADGRESGERTDGLRGEFEELRTASGQLVQELTRVKDLSRETRDEANATVDIVREVEKRLGPLTELQDLMKTTDERMMSLNALAEHVGQKTKALENQKHTVEHAVVESNRLNEMIWSMEVQINKLNAVS